MQVGRLVRKHRMFGEKSFVMVETYGANKGMMKNDVGKANEMNYEKSYISG